MHSQRLHILILPKWYPFAEDPQNGSFIAHYAQELSAHHKVSVVFPYPVVEETPIEVNEQNGLLEVRVPYVQSLLLWTPIRKLINYVKYRNALNLGVMHLLEKRDPPQLIHAQVLIRPALFADRFSQHWEVPWLLTEHSSEFLRRNALSSIKKRIIAQLCRRANYVVAVSPTLAERLKQVTRRDDIKTIPNLVDFKIKASPPTSSEVIHIGIVADLVDHIKNISGVLQALANIKDQIPDYKLSIVGDGPDAEKLKSLTNELNLNQNVTFLGRKEHAEVLEFLPEIHFLITNSRTETFSIVTAEAIASGRPVIVTRCGGPDEWFSDDYGIMVNPDQQEELETAILKMCRDHNSYDSEKLANAIREQFNPELVIEAYERLYYRMTES